LFKHIPKPFLNFFPPIDEKYPVDPKGVETTTPSAITFSKVFH